MRNVAIYARVSTEHEAQINALSNQIQYYDNILKMHPDWKLVARYIDEGITGTSVNKRQNFMRMMEDAEAGKFSLIITREVSRFARNTVDTLQQTRILRRQGVEVYFTEDNIWTMDDEDGELRLTLMATLAQNESKKISVRVKAGQKISFENGILYGNGNILGYDRDGSNLIINPDQAKTVRMIFDLYLDGLGCTNIARELEKRGRLTSMGLSIWQPATISRILRNPFYCGRVVYRKQFVPDYLEQKKINNFGDVETITVQGTHETIITEEEFDKVQKVLDYRSVTKNRGRAGRRKPKPLYSRLLICECGSNFERLTWHKYKDGRVQKGYQCYKQANMGSYKTRLKKGLSTEGACGVPIFPQWKLGIVSHYLFNDFWKDKKSIIKKAISIIEQAEQNVANEEDSHSTELEQLQIEKEKLQTKLNNLVELMIEGDIPKTIYEEKKSVIRKQLEYCEKRIDEFSIKESGMSITEIQKDYLEKLLDSEFNSVKGAIPDELIETFVERIIVHKDYYEWRLKKLELPIRCKVSGRDNNRSVEFFEVKSSETEMQHRQLLANVQNNLIYPTKPIELGTFTITKDYLAEYKKTDENMVKVNKWSDIKVKITI